MGILMTVNFIYCIYYLLYFYLCKTLFWLNKFYLCKICTINSVSKSATPEYSWIVDPWSDQFLLASSLPLPCSFKKWEMLVPSFKCRLWSSFKLKPNQTLYWDLNQHPDSKSKSFDQPEPHNQIPDSLTFQIF